MRLPGLTVILDAPNEAGDDDGTWIQIAKQGRFKDPRYGPFKIDQRYFDKWLENFAKFDADEGVPIDEDHAPENGRGTKAVGWIKALEQRGREMWAKVKWNSTGKTLIADEVYKFLSPTYSENFKDEQGDSHGTKLKGAALTNRPFLDMATVTLSRLDSEEIADDDEISPTADSPRQMNPELLKALGLEEGADEAKVLEAVQALQAKADKPAESETGEKTLDELAKEQGVVVLSADKVLELQQDAAKGKAAHEQLHESKFDTAFTKALEKGTVLKAEKEDLKDLYDLAPEKTLASIEARPVIVNTQARGSGAAPAGGGSGTTTQDVGDKTFAVDEDAAELDEKVRTLMASDSSLGYEDALDKVLEQRDEAVAA